MTRHAYPAALGRLIETLRAMPGVGPKSAQRIAFHLLERDRNGALEIGRALTEATQRIGHCRICRMFAEGEICPVCDDPGRDVTTLCIVESPADVLVLDDATDFNGRYFVLMGHISPLDGIGPRELGIELLESMLAERPIREVIIATNPTVEGDATAHFLIELCNRHGVAVSRIAHGVPIGGELEYVDGGTLSHAFNGRRVVDVPLAE